MSDFQPLSSGLNFSSTLNAEYSDYDLRNSSSSNMNLKTLGTIPIFSIGSPSVLPVPIECVFPDPV